jgi:hypothetical protein
VSEKSLNGSNPVSFGIYAVDVTIRGPLLEYFKGGVSSAWRPFFEAVLADPYWSR